MGTEDGAVLAECLDQARSTEEISQYLMFYEALRKPRTKTISDASTTLLAMWTMPDGEGQQQRDKRMKEMPVWQAKDWDGKPIDKVPDSLRDATYPAWVMSHDAADFVSLRYL